MKVSLRKRMIAGAIATLLSAPAWTASVTADDPAKARAGAQAASETKTDTERASGTGTSQSGSATGTTSGSAGAGTSGSAGTGTSGSAGTGTSGSAGASTSGSAGAGATAAGSGTTSPSMGASSTSRSMGAGTARLNPDNPLYARTVKELEGTDIVDATGNEIGEIQKVVLTQDRRSAHAVVSVGGFLGIGDRDIAVSLDEFRPAEDDKLQLNATKEDLKARPKYVSEEYVALEGDQPISGSITDFAAFETDRNKTTRTPRDSDANKTMDKAMDKTMDKDKAMRQPATGSGSAGASGGTTGSGATGSGTTGSGTTK